MLDKMIDDHWKYVKGVLLVHGIPVRDVNFAEHHYRTAFVHGWKHAKEDSDKGKTVLTTTTVRFMEDESEPLGVRVVKRRGEKEVYAFAEAMIETLNLPKNAAKGGWDDMTLGQLMDRLQEEEAELNDALFCEEGMNLDPKSEATDVAAFAMMIFDKLSKKD